MTKLVKNKKSIWGNTIVKNEGRFVWFAVSSVINYLDQMLVWDTGSTDNTVEVIKLLQKKYPQKIKFRQIGQVNEESFTQARQQMLEETKSDWLFILDGDEVWWDSSIEKIIDTINSGNNLDLIVTPLFSIVGDIYHYQEEEAGRYQLMGKKGHLNIRAINRKIPGLHVTGPYGREGYFDNQGKRIQDRGDSRSIYLDTPYMHFSNIRRSNILSGDREVMQRERKIRYELGKNFPKDFKYPEVFFKPYPPIVPSPWIRMNSDFKLRAFIETPLRKFKRRIF